MSSKAVFLRVVGEVRHPGHPGRRTARLMLQVPVVESTVMARSGGPETCLCLF